MLLRGRSAVVTDSSSGIGRAIALQLASEGAAIVVNARNSGAEGMRAVNGVVDEIRASGGQAIGVAGSVDDSAFATRLIECCVDVYGKIDILINNTATYRADAIEPAAHCPIEECHRIMQVNLNGAFYTSRMAVPHMKRERWGRIVNAAFFAHPSKMGSSAYNAAKTALFGLGRAMAADCSP